MRNICSNRINGHKSSGRSILYPVDEILIYASHFTQGIDVLAVRQNCNMPKNQWNRKRMEEHRKKFTNEFDAKLGPRLTNETVCGGEFLWDRSIDVSEINSLLIKVQIVVNSIGSTFGWKTILPQRSEQINLLTEMTQQPSVFYRWN